MQYLLHINNRYAITYNNLAFIWMERNGYDKCLDLLNQCLSVNPNYMESNYTIAQVYFLKGDKENALKYFTFLKQNFPAINNEVEPI